MKNTFGNSIRITLFGESHGECVGAVLDGIAPGIKTDDALIRARLSQRAPAGDISTSRTESDKYEILSGVFRGYTTGEPICIVIPNENAVSSDYEKISDIIRPGHADYTAYIRSNGYNDHRGGGHHSGRLTAPIVAAGAIVESALASVGVKYATHIKRCAGIDDMPLSGDLCADIKKLKSIYFATLSDGAGEAMQKKIKEAAQKGDSVGGVLETVVTGLPAGTGEPFFDSLESKISHALFSIPGIKGVQFGLGFDGVDLFGSEYNDSFRTDGENIYTKTNNNGGINGGLSNGMPIVFTCAVKPTPSIAAEQESVNIKTMENTTLQIGGRHDPAIIHRVRAVVDAMTALTLADALCARYGSEYFVGEQR